MIALASLVPSQLVAQQAIGLGTELEQYVRILEVEGGIEGTPLVFHAASLRPGEKGLHADSTHLWANHYSLRAVPRSREPVLLPFGWQAGSVYNSAFPRTGNDGALWAGRGVSGRLSGGAELRWGPLIADLNPQVIYQQNQAFTLAPVPPVLIGRSKYGFPWLYGIDLPQRFGESSLQSLDWNQSNVRLDVGPMTAALSTEDLWWGPGVRNSILLSNTAPGFPHVDLGTGRPVMTPIGAFEARMVWGALRRSDYFDSVPPRVIFVPDPGRRYLSGVTLGYRPSFLPGLTLGAMRILYQEWPTGGLSVGDVLNVFGGVFNQGNRDLGNGIVSNDLTDQIASVMARWVFPRSGFEVYGEYARNDFPGSLRDLLTEPDHSRAITTGFQKTLKAREGRWRLAGEMTTLANTGTSLLRDAGAYYSHVFAIEGYTNGGQLMGAAIGPGSNSRYLGLDRYSRSGRWGVFLERVRFDDDYFFFGDGFQPGFAGVPLAYLRHQVDLTLGGSVFRFAGPVELGARLELTRELNRYFELGNDVTNVKLVLNAQWRTGSPESRGGESR